MERIVTCDSSVLHGSSEARLPLASSEVAISVIIPVYNDWDVFPDCLASLNHQNDPPRFEVVVVDDGSSCPAPEWIHRQSLSYPLITVRQQHSGVSVARNYGVQTARGQVFMFVDADCILDIDCLRRFDNALKMYTDDDVFQLRIKGGAGDVVGTAEELHLTAVQTKQLYATGRIRYLNTSGAAIRRRRTNPRRGLFDARALRAQDTLLLAELIGHGELPRFVRDAVIIHAPKLPVLQYLLKGLVAGFAEGKTYMFIRAMDVSIRTSGQQRFSILKLTLKKARCCPKGGRGACVLILQRLLRIIGTMAFRLSCSKVDTDDFQSGLTERLDSVGAL